MGASLLFPYFSEKAPLLTSGREPRVFMMSPMHSPIHKVGGPAVSH